MTDTDGILDHCHCGAFAKMMSLPGFVGVYCTECAEMITAETPDQAMVEWNQKMRSYK